MTMPSAAVPRIDLNKMRKKWDHWLLLFPSMIMFGLFFLIPLCYLFSTSFYSEANGQEWTMKNYSSFLSDPFYRDILYKTLKISLVTTLLVLVFAYPLAYHLVHVTGRKRNYLTLLLVSPMLISEVIRNYGWIIMLTSKGTINNTLLALGIIHEPLKLLFTEFSVEIGMIHVLFPYMVLSLVGSLERIEPSVIRAAQSLGASPFKTFLSVIFPLSLPGIFAGSVIVFSLTASSFVTPSILGGSKVKVVSYLAYEQVTVLLNWPYGAAIGFILIAMATLTLLLYSGLLRNSKLGVAMK